MLKDSFPSLIQITSNKEATIALIQIPSNKEATIAQYRHNNYWTPIFSRNFQDWVINDFLSLLETLQNTTLVVEDQDTILWGDSKEKTYTVKTCYKKHEHIRKAFYKFGLGNISRKLDSHLDSPEGSMPNSRLFQEKRGIIPSRCVMCKQTNESVNYLFVHFPPAASLCILSTLCLAYNG